LTKNIVFTEKAPKPVGPYSQAVISGDFVFVSGQIAIDPKSSKVIDGGIEAQTVQVLENLKNILESVDLSLNDVVKTSVTSTTFKLSICSTANILTKIRQHELQSKQVSWLECY
jgi:reactive intermediate/imine deaminase